MRHKPVPEDIKLKVLAVLKEELDKPRKERKSHSDIGKAYGVSRSFVSYIGLINGLTKDKDAPRKRAGLTIADNPILGRYTKELSFRDHLNAAKSSLVVPMPKPKTADPRKADDGGRYIAPERKPRIWSPGSIPLPSKQQLMRGR